MHHGDFEECSGLQFPIQTLRTLVVILVEQADDLPSSYGMSSRVTLLLCSIYAGSHSGQSNVNGLFRASEERGTCDCNGPEDNLVDEGWNVEVRLGTHRWFFILNLLLGCSRKKCRQQ
nr:uncharacterized protein LOC112286451 [Physcomitrium patens]|eukprot:XP_024384116.1 uncharacterized protein LOC112286451 [Physcomitrella patens]